MEKGNRHDTVLFNLNEKNLKKAVEVMGNLKIRDTVVETIKYSDDLVLIAKEE